MIYAHMMISKHDFDRLKTFHSVGLSLRIYISWDGENL